MKRIVFVHIPKTSGTSLRNALSDVEGLEDIRHSTLKRRRVKPSEAFSFCFVRNPYSRLRSAFFHLIKVRNTPREDEGAFNPRRREIKSRFGDDFDRFVRERGFEEFIDLPHFFHQSHWVREGGRRAVNFIGYFERLPEDFSRLCAEIGVAQRPLPHRNVSDRKEFAWSDEAAEIAWTAYREDFEFLGYDKDQRRTGPRKPLETVVNLESA